LAQRGAAVCVNYAVHADAAAALVAEITTAGGGTIEAWRNRPIVRAYRALTYRGGVDADVESQSDVGEEFNLPTSTTVVETRKYAFHRKIERNRTAARQAKKFHGTACQACNLDFAKRYGSIGKGFIEAHHLKAISTLEEGVAVHYDVAGDFAVLCSNCHRMIHRSADPSDLAAFRALVQSNET
jgi:5-methylcytosine-specific restriction enzyme A